MKAELLPPAPIERIRSHLVGLRMPRALETLDHIVQQLERGQIGAIEAIDMLLAEEITIREGQDFLIGKRTLAGEAQWTALGILNTLRRYHPRRPLQRWQPSRIPPRIIRKARAGAGQGGGRGDGPDDHGQCPGAGTADAGADCAGKAGGAAARPGAGQ
jgi:hypothetical protein